MEKTIIILSAITFMGVYSYPVSDKNSPYCFDYDFDDDSTYKQYLSDEITKDSVFKSRWNKPISGVPNAKHYTENELRAIRTYTGDCVYPDFNTATRNLVGGTIKYVDYKYKALHYYLSSAIEKSKTCYSTLYRGMKFKDTTSKVGDTSFRFKQFASSSQSYGTAKGFSGLKGTIYKLISTCTGADISQYSCYPGEEEVLIPPCSEFTVTKVTEETSWNPRSIVLNKGDTFRKVTTLWFIITTCSFLFQF